MHWLEFPAIELQVISGQAVLKAVELDEPAVTKHCSKMFSAQVPKGRKREGSVQVEPFDLAL